MSGQREEYVRMAAFSDDIRSDGSPSLFQEAITASSTIKLSGSTPSVKGIAGCRRDTH